MINYYIILFIYIGINITLRLLMMMTKKLEKRQNRNMLDFKIKTMRIYFPLKKNKKWGYSCAPYTPPSIVILPHPLSRLDQSNFN